MGKKLNLEGKRFGRWTVISEFGRNNGGVTWLCKCDCGTVRPVLSTSLVSGTSVSCGCYNKEVNTSHNLSRTPLYKALLGMIERCTHENHPQFKDYGARGITVCEEWMNDRESFFDWSIKNGYREGLTIDRIDNNKGYSPDNCRWVSMKVQCRNRRSNAVIEYKGEKHCLSEWAELLNENYCKLHSRYRRGWSAREILFGRA